MDAVERDLNDLLWANLYDLSVGRPVGEFGEPVRLPVEHRVGHSLLIELARTGEIDPNSNVLYAHLGGQPAINAYSALFKN